MLLHLAIGDAYGVGFEYVRPALIRAHNDLSGYVQHPSHSTIHPGQYSDDTQMSLAVAEAILQSVRPTPLQWAEHFWDSFRRNPRQGYAGRFYDFLCSVKSAQDFLERIRPYSEKSGAAMRALPLGFLPDLPQLLTVSADQARLTHNTPAGIQSAQAVALAAHYFLYRLGPRGGLADFISTQVGGHWTGWRGKVGETGVEAVRAALTALMECNSMADLLRRCVAYQGDVDTVACIALGAAATCPEVARDLPRVLYSDLENGSYGRDYLVGLQTQLVQRFPGTTLGEET